MSRPSNRICPAVGLDEAQQQPADGALAAAGLAHQAQGLLLVDLEVHLAHRAHVPDDALHRPALDREHLRHVAGLDQHLAHGASWNSQQRTLWPGSVSTRSGSVTVQISRPCSTRARQREAKRQSGGQVDEVGHPAGDDVEPFLAGADDGDRPDEAHGVGVLRPGEEGLGGGFLDDAPGVHDRHPVGHLGHDAQVVGDEDDGHAQVGPELEHEVEDLGLDGDVEGGGRLVGDEQFRARRPAPWRSSPAGPCPPTARAGRTWRGAPGRRSPPWPASRSAFSSPILCLRPWWTS